MTVTVPPKADIPKTDTNDNETCCTDKNTSAKLDHTGSLLENCSQTDRDSSSSETQEESLSKGNECEHDYKKEIRLLDFEEAPEYLKHNAFILSGYRGLLNTKLCVESIFWWTNETINIWSHIFGFALFLGLTIYDLILLKVHASLLDKFFVAVLLFCFQACMALSALYHTFSCRSEHDFNYFLSFDLFGIALSLLAIYMSGIYYAFWCHEDLLNFYLVTVTVIFIVAMTLQHQRFNINSNAKMAIFVLWAAYGVVPTFHWSLIMGGFENPVVNMLLPRILGMYVISGTAFLIYLTKVPERFSAGKFDYLGHSHQWWHIFVVFALYYWHNTGMMYAEYRMNHACSDHMRVY